MKLLSSKVNFLINNLSVINICFISSEWKTALGQEEHKIDYLKYRYSDEGLLEAKESGILGSLQEDRQDAFRYFYDTQGKLILQKEFDPNFGFQQKGSTKFFYYAEN